MERCKPTKEQDPRP